MQGIQSSRFGDYYLTAHMGRGGMADIYRARYVGAAGFQRTVVIKRILNAHNDDHESVRMFINEAKLAAELTHPNIAQIYELGEIDGEFFIAMEYVRGKDLREVLSLMASRKASIPPAVAACIARDICRALARAHAHTGDDGEPRPIIHRDVSPSNVVISYDGQVKLVDFGIAKALTANSDRTHTQAGLLKGKLGYMAPEQADGLALPQSDIFATGIVLHEMLTLQRLFKGETALDTMGRVKAMHVAAPGTIAPGIPAALDSIVLRALERDLDLRYATAASMAKDLDLYLQSKRFAVEDLGTFMTELYPTQVQTDPSHVVSSPRYVAAQSTRSTSSVMFSLPPVPEPEISIQVNPVDQPLVTKRRLLLGAALALLPLAAYIGFQQLQGERAAMAMSAPPISVTPIAHVDRPAIMPAVALHRAAEPVAVRGVTDTEVVFGMAAAISGPGKEYGRQMQVGIEAAFDAANDLGGVHGRRLRLVVVDDGYEPGRTVVAMRQLQEEHQVFGFVGNTGTPTAAVAVPMALERRMLFFGAFTGAGLLRRDPPDRYVFNFRASYAEESAAIIRYLVKVRGIRPEHIAVFAQEDAFGEAGVASVTKAVRGLRSDVRSIFRVGYKRNTIDVNDAVSQLTQRPIRVRAVVMLALYRPAAKFIEKVRDADPNMLFVSGSYVDGSALAEELKMLGPKYASGVVVTQVVPSPESSATAVLDYKASLATYKPLERTDCISLEGYLMAKVLIEGLRRAGPELDTETLVDALEGLRDLELGLGTPISFGPVEHQGSHRVWGTRLDETGHYQPLDLE